MSGLLVISPAFFSPINAINIPIPPEIANLKLYGTLLTMRSRILKIVSRIKAIPSMKTAVSAVCHE